MEVAYIPVQKDERLVEQTGVTVNARVNRIPRLARSSRTGVETSFVP